jgi:Serine/threonine protein kinase
MDESKWQEIKKAFEAAVELPTIEREAFLANCDPDLRSEIETLLSADDEADKFIAEPAFVAAGFHVEQPADQYIGRQIDSYKIIKEIGRGGMGTVYLATHADKSFDKTVAVKLIKRGMDTNAVLKRFVMERQILARLEHPNIAGLLDGGSTADGLPYLVMEYFEGEPITKFSDSRMLGVEERLELFCKVCDAISYAHQNLVVHRDIKPSNILVTADGIPKLLDFGIAKLLHPDWSLETAEATATMFRIMTPEYASPEQIQGLPITTASDVYSLGVVLYELLSGERPYKIDSRLPDEAARIVLTAEPIRPSSVISSGQSATDKTANETGASSKRTSGIQNLRSLRGDLDNIILKALQKEPSRRYPSVHEFSEDIRRHIDGLPVRATADSSFYRLGKFVKRHRAGVLATGLIALTLLIATSITTWQAVIARRERDKAERRFNQVRKLANTVLFEYHDGIAKLAGSTPIREKMIKDAIEYLDNLASENIEDVSLQRELASAYEKVGDVQGNPFLANLGDKDGALESYHKALSIRELLLKGDPGDPQRRFDLASADEKIGDMFWAKGESANAEKSYTEALAIFSDLERNGTLSDTYRMVGISYRIGETQEQAGNFDEAIENYQASLDSAHALVAIEPDNLKYRRGVGVAFTKIGDILYLQHKYSEAAERFKSSFPIFRDIAAADPSNMALSRTLGLIVARLALVEMEAADYSHAIEHGLQAIKIEENIAEVDPNDSQIHYDLADTTSNLGETYGRKGDIAAADKYFNQAIEIFNDLKQKNADYAQMRSHNGNTYMTYAGILFSHGRAANALSNYRLARELLESSTDEDSLEKLAQTYDGLADAMAAVAKSGGTNDAIRDLYQRSLNTLDQIGSKNKLNDEDVQRQSSVTVKLKKYDMIAARSAK